MAEIRSKRQFFELWEAGVLGNRTRLWRTPDDAWQWVKTKKTRIDSPEPMIGFRELRRPGTTGAGKWEKVPWYQMWSAAERWRAEGRDFIMDDGAPNELTTLLGEVVRTERGMVGYLARVALPMRQALTPEYARQYSYLETRLLLERYMDPSSRDDLDAIFELFPDAAVEFACFSVNVGIFPGRNTLFWETRNY